MKIPVLSAAMDTVSESELAIALAREGGLAVIHRNNPIDIQAAMVSRVKRFENAVIPNPVTVNKDMTLEEVHQIMMDQGYSGFPVVDANRRLEGICHRTRHARRGRLPEHPGQGRNDPPFPPDYGGSHHHH